MYRYTIEFPVTCNSISEIEKALDIKFKGGGWVAFLLDNIDEKNTNIYHIEIYKLFYINDMDPDDDPDSIGALKFNALNITFITNIMTKICNVLKNYTDFKFTDCIICDNITDKTKSLVSYIE